MCVFCVLRMLVLLAHLAEDQVKMLSSCTCFSVHSDSFRKLILRLPFYLEKNRLQSCIFAPVYFELAALGGPQLTTSRSGRAVVHRQRRRRSSRPSSPPHSSFYSPHLHPNCFPPLPLTACLCRRLAQTQQNRAPSSASIPSTSPRLPALRVPAP